MPTEPFFNDGNLDTALPCGQARITFPFEGDSHAPVNQIAWLVFATNPTGFKYILLPPDPSQTNTNNQAFILEQEFQQHKDAFFPLAIGTSYDAGTFWPDYRFSGTIGALQLSSLVLVSEGPTTDLTAGQVKWTRTYATVPPPRNTYENFVFTFPGLVPDKLGTQTNDDLAALPGLGNLTSGGAPITVEVPARVEHIYFQIPSGSYSPNVGDPSQPDYIIPTFRVFFGNFYNEQSVLFDANWQDIIDWVNTTLSGGSTTPPAFNTIPPATAISPNADDNDADSGVPYNQMVGTVEICVKQSVIRPWRGNIYEKITLFAVAR